jgi:peptidoglycan/xylan/chitin deacetylase (PgdA/CDA1 family)
MSVYARHGQVVRVLFLAVAVGHWILLALARRAGRRRRDTVVLCYHGITPEQRRRFAWQMSRLEGRAVAVDELAHRRDQDPERPLVCVTFDDGFSCLLVNAFAVLGRWHIPVMIFPVTQNLGVRPRWRMPPDHPDAQETVLSAYELLAASRAGLCTVGSHTRRHPDLARSDRPTLQQELSGSKADLEDLLAVSVENIALPYGSYSPQVLARAFDAGYERVFTLDPRMVSPGPGNAVVGRFRMSPDVWRVEFLLTCAGAYGWLDVWRRFRHGLHSLGARFRSGVVRDNPKEEVCT